jgi:signal transduction histidine kinase
MRISSFIPFAVLATCLKKWVEIPHTVAFRLTLWYMGIFSVSLIVTLVAFYELVLHGVSDIGYHALRELREDYRHYFIFPVAAIICLSTAVGWFMAKRALSGVEEVTRAAVDISKGALNRRVPVKGARDEVDDLAAAFNIMADRVQSLLDQMKEMTENIAHDLRSPLARMRGIAEMALMSHNPDEERTTIAGSIVEECDRLLGMINAMLDISEAETGLAKLHIQPIDLSALVKDVKELFDPLAEDRNIEVTIEGPESLSIQGDPKKLQRVFSNLLDNAIKYSPYGGRVTISLTNTEDHTTVVVEDSGEGIPEEDMPRVFDRFFRGEKSRSTPGNGLGLSLAQAFIRLHGGAITAVNKQGCGSIFTVTLPVSKNLDTTNKR